MYSALHRSIGFNEGKAVQQREKLDVAIPMNVILSHGRAGDLTIAGDVLDRRSFKNPTTSGRFAHFLNDRRSRSDQSVIQSLLSGVSAALIVSQYGVPDPVHGGLTLDPAKVAKYLGWTARNTACATPVITYGAEGRDASYDAECLGDADFNGIYGEGIVDAAAAVTAPFAL